MCQHDTTPLSRGVETRPHPTESHDQLDSDIGLVWLERPLHLVLKGLFLLRTLRVSAGTHAADRNSDAPLHRTDELLIDGEIIGHEHNALLVVVTRKGPQDVQRRCLLHGELHTDANDCQTHVRITSTDRTGLREGELHRLVAQLEVRLLYQELLREPGEGVTLRSLGGLQPPQQT